MNPANHGSGDNRTRPPINPSITDSQQTRDHVSTPSLTPPLARPVPPAPTPIPGFQVLSRLGAGGMGVVYKAKDLSLNRIVAIKLIKSGDQATPRDLKRFVEAEAAAAARLQHPRIAQLHQCGVHQGQPYFVMEFVDGDSLDMELRRKPWPDRKRIAEILIGLAEAMQHAHDRGVIHRDLKPSNVLMAADGTAKITDFGLAKLADVDQRLTQSGAVVGTPAYMSPEQAEGKPVGPETDVYSLGAILYELLTGRPPFLREDVPLAKAMHRIVHEEVVSPRKIKSETPRDLETICLKCLEKSPERRYRTAQALADDLARFQRGESIQARPASLFNRTWKWARRRPAQASLAMFLVLAALGSVSVASWMYRNEVRHGLALEQVVNDKEAQRQRAVANEKAAEANARAAREQEAIVRRNLYEFHISVAWREWHRKNVAAALERLKKEIPLPGKEDVRSFEWRYLWNLCRQSLMTVESPRPLGRAVAFSPDGLLLAVGVRGLYGDSLKQAQDGDILLWDVPTGKLKETLRGHADSVTDLAFTPDGSRLVSASQDASVRIWDIKAQTSQRLPDRVGPVQALAISPDGNVLVFGGRDDSRPSKTKDYPGKICLWDLKKNTEIGCFAVAGILGDEGVHRLALSPGGTLLAMGDERGAIVLWDMVLRRAMTRMEGHLGIVMGLEFSPDGKTLASVGGRVQVSDDMRTLSVLRHAEDGRHEKTTTYAVNWANRSKAALDGGEIKLWTVAGPDHMTLQTTLLPAGNRFTAIAFSPDGRTLAAGDSEHLVTLWDASTGEKKTTFRGHSRLITGLAFSPAGGVLVSVGADNGMQCWDPATVSDGALPPALPTAPKADVDSLSFSGDGSILATGDQFAVRLWDAATRRHLGRLAHGGKTDYQVAFSPTEKIVAIGTRTLALLPLPGTVTLWDAVAQKKIADLGEHVGGVGVLEFTADGRHLVSIDEKGWAKVWDRSTLQEIAHKQVSQMWPFFLRMTSDGKSFAVRDQGDKVTAWSIPDLQPRGELAGARSVAFDASRKAAITLNSMGQMTLWNWPECTRRGRLPETVAEGPSRLHVAPDGRTLVANLVPIRFMDPFTGEERFTIDEPGNNFNNLVFSKDGNRIAAGKTKVRIWNAPAPDVSARDLTGQLPRLNQVAAPREACRSQLVRWLDDNLVADPDSPLVSQFDDAHDQGGDFSLILGNLLTKTGKPYWLRTHRDQFFVFELTAQQLRALDAGPRESHAEAIAPQKDTAAAHQARVEFPRGFWKDDGVTMDYRLCLSAPVRPAGARAPLAVRRLLFAGKNPPTFSLLTLKGDDLTEGGPLSFQSKASAKVLEAGDVPMLVFFDVCEDHREPGSQAAKLVSVSNVVGALIQGERVSESPK